MIELRDIDPSTPFLAQLQGPDDGRPITLVNTFVVPEGQIDKVIDVWRQDSMIMKAQPGFVSAQLYRGAGDGRALTNVAVWETLTSLRNAFMSEEFQNTLPLYPDGSLAFPVVMRGEAVPGVCVA
ncbi:antibiotic biosynthesis monooxygenase family protein [Streptomyces sp. NPDC013157]|uniref:antibiotic biosynthesis monooxygenase family protein n=1 Tax=unclassified Streptomyces TaxID=2593676 RepID=UPI002E80A0F5|nr:antibiotic biosynthesis monooxygenase family protein [Streptomyces sp. NBC_00582]WUB67518.1 antibiotic biosynthesis monooxygenase [Streptomyces sp. NBC_00582]